MRAPVSFFELLQEAVRLVIQTKPLLWLLFPLGLLLFITATQSESASEFLSAGISSPDELLPFLREHSRAIIILTSFTLLSGSLRAALRGPIFLLIEQTLLRRSLKEPTPQQSLHKKHYLRSSGVAFLFEGSYWITLLVLSLALFSPLLMAITFNPELGQTIGKLALLLLLVLAVIFFYIKEFSLLYVLLAHIRPRLALDLGLNLFQKHLALSLLFGFFLITLSFLFTFLFNFAIITSALIPLSALQSLSKFLSGSIILGFATLLTDALHLLFFHALAATPRIKLADLKKYVGEKKNIREIPSA